MSIQKLSLKAALQVMLDEATDLMMLAAGAALSSGGALTTWGMPYRPASELAADYRLRLEAVEGLGIDIAGMPEAIRRFDSHGAGLIDTVTIYGVDRDYLLFFNDEDRSLIACVSLPTVVGLRLTHIR